MRKQLALAAIGLAGLTAGAGAGLVLTGGSGDASAQTSPTSPDTTAPSSDTTTTDSGGQQTGTEQKDPGQRLKDVLAPLVEKGTITQSQADAVIAAIEAARPARGDGPHGGPGRGRFGHGGFGLDAAATAIGITSDELRTALEGGQTIADVAKAKGVELSKVTDAMLAAYTKHEQDEVTAGQETQAEADTEIAAFKDRLDDIVNGKLPPRPDRGGQPPQTTTTTG
jgi:hypothetical protein